MADKTIRLVAQNTIGGRHRKVSGEVFDIPLAVYEKSGLAASRKNNGQAAAVEYDLKVHGKIVDGKAPDFIKGQRERNSDLRQVALKRRGPGPAKRN